MVTIAKVNQLKQSTQHIVCFSDKKPKEPIKRHGIVFASRLQFAL